MTNIQEVNAKAFAAFQEGSPEKAFNILLAETDPEHFVSFCEKREDQTRKGYKRKKRNWFTDKKSADFFWKDYVLRDYAFQSLFQDDESALQLLHNYFSRYKGASLVLEEKLAQHYPALFIKAVRTNQAFLKSGRIESLISLSLPSNAQAHRWVWRVLYQEEQQLWSKVEKALASVVDLKLEEVFGRCVSWLERIRFHSSTNEHLHQLATVYSMFIDLIIDKRILDVDDDIDPTHVVQNYFRLLQDGAHHPVYELLDSIYAWVVFEQGILSPYSFDLSSEPKDIDGVLSLCWKPSDQYKWLVDEYRYTRYVLTCWEKGNDNYFGLDSRILPAVSLLKKLGVHEFGVEQRKVPVQDLITPLSIKSANLLHRYEHEILELNASSKTYQAVLQKQLVKMHHGMKVLPAFLMNMWNSNQVMPAEDSISWTADVASVTEKLFTYEAPKKFKANRFKRGYDVWSRPFLKLGDSVFCPTMFFANLDWFYSIAQVAMTNARHDREETKRMEQYFEKCIKAKGWRTKLIEGNEADQIDGDVDVIVEDDNTTLFIQLKRTYFRTNTKEMHFEASQVDKKASVQLNKAEKFFQGSKSIHSVQHTPVKWIVTTSFEKIGANIQGCLKVNYFEILRALEEETFSSLSDFIKFMETDQGLKNDLYPSHKTGLMSAIDGVAVFKSSDYQKVIRFSEERKEKLSERLFNEALKHGNKTKAEELLRLYIGDKPKDGDGYSALANVLADMGKLSESYKAFETALKLLPDDPHISRNYALALLQGGLYSKGLQVLIDLLESYPLMTELMLNFIENVADIEKDLAQMKRFTL